MQAFPSPPLLLILKGWYVVKGESFITSEGIVGDVGVVGPWDKHECPQDDNGPCAVCILLLNVASDKETPNHQQKGASREQHKRVPNGFPGNALCLCLKLSIDKTIVLLTELLVFG